MGRPKWRDAPTDPKELQSFVESILQTSVSKSVTHILQNYPRRRDLHFSSDSFRIQMNLGPVLSKLAVTIQLRGEDCKNICDSCAWGDVPFTGCIHIPGEQYGRCGNCVYLGKPCSCGNGEQTSFYPCFGSMLIITMLKTLRAIVDHIPSRGIR